MRALDRALAGGMGTIQECFPEEKDRIGSLRFQQLHLGSLRASVCWVARVLEWELEPDGIRSETLCKSPCKWAVVSHY